MFAHSKTRRLVWLFIGVIALAPMAILVEHFLNGKMASIHSALRHQRLELTQLSNQRHLLSAYIERLRQDEPLVHAVEHGKPTYSQWQTPLHHMRLRLVDGANDIAAKDVSVSSVSLHWLDDPSTQMQGASTVQNIWLHTTVTSVQSAIAVLQSVQDVAKPYPLQTLGCSYQHKEKHTDIQAQCALRLEAWVLPELNAEVVANRGSTDSLSDVQPPVKKSIPVEWRLFNKSDGIGHAIKPGLMTPSKLKTMPVASDELVSKAIITGPAGRMVIHVPSE